MNIETDNMAAFIYCAYEFDISVATKGYRYDKIHIY